MLIDKKILKQYAVYTAIFAVAYLVTGLLTPLFADMTFGSFIDNVGKGVSSASASIR